MIETYAPPTMTPTETVYVLDGSEGTFIHSEDGGDLTLNVTPPNDRVRDALVEVFELVDQADCQADAHTGLLGRRGAIGFYLHGDADENMGWRHVALVDDGHRCFRVCEDCHATLLPQSEAV
jgi:hypothetical protein